MTTFTKHRFHVLDGMRGLAAVVVMAYHWFYHEHFIFLRNPFIAVDFFFILSGFVICYAYGTRIDQGLSISDYIARRIGRLYPLMFTSVLIGAPFFYLSTLTAETDFTIRDSLTAFAQNLFMLPYLTGKKVGTDIIALFPGSGPLWSIFFELIASISFPLLFRLSDRKLRAFCLCSLGVLIASAFLRGFTGHGRLLNMDGGWGVENFFGGFPRIAFGFSCGMLLYKLRQETMGTSRAASFRANPWALYAALVGILIFPSYVQGAYPIFAVSVLAPALVWYGSVATCHSRFTIIVSEFLGWLSYPLYCLHWPAFAAVRGLYADGGNGFGVPEPVAAFGAAVVLSIIVGVLIDRLGLQKKLTDLLIRITRRVAQANA